MNLNDAKILNRYGLFKYQRRWLADSSRFKIALWARQTGKDFTAAAEAVIHSRLHPGATWIVLAAGERQALESIDKAKVWAEAFHIPISECTENFTPHPGIRPPGGPRTRLLSSQIKWANGARFIALPGKPETVRGYSANIILTEFAFHDDPEAIWRAIYPSISNPLRGGEKKLRIISTPNGLGNKFAELWHHGRDYSKHKVDIHEASRQGLELDVEELRRGLRDEQAWAQEYECEFADGAEVLLPYDLIESCESADAVETAEARELSARRDRNRPLFMGIDFGRKRHLTVAWILERKGGVLETREVLALKGLSTPEQVEALRPRVGLCQRVALDYTGGGIGLGDQLAREFSEYRRKERMHGKVELCAFTPALKAELYPRLRAAFERREVRIPISRAIREDLHGVQRWVSANGAITYRAADREDGHSDRATALALALRAASQPGSHGVTIIPARPRWRVRI